jgi:hypothetical protein
MINLFKIFRSKEPDFDRVRILAQRRAAIQKLDRIRSETDLYAELHQQCVLNVRQLESQIRTLQSQINSPIGAKKTRDQRARLDRRLEWLAKKREEEEFMSGYYGYLKDYPYF